MKIGRVRFKVREICSPAYHHEQIEEKKAAEQFKSIQVEIEKHFDANKDKDKSEEFIEDSVIVHDEDDVGGADPSYVE